MTLRRRAIEVYRNEGPFRLFVKAIGQFRDQEPTVTDGSRPGVVWTLKPFYDALFVLKHGRGTDVMAEDWDTLVLLDACRYDDFRRTNTIDGRLESRISRGADSRGFIDGNFRGRELHDTVYVTANPHVSVIDDGVFHSIVTEPLSAWDEEFQCVKPDAVTDAAVEAHREYPNKRVVVHYMQPHDPPLGPTAEEIRGEVDLGGPAPDDRESTGTRMMPAVAEGTIPVETARRAYRETLEIALEEVRRLLDAVDGKVVISSDHGEMFGERPYLPFGKLYEHYRNPRTVELCKVPWLVVDGSASRREVRSEEPSVRERGPSDEELTEQLEALGYRG